MKHTLLKLPYARDALAPHLSRETIDFHYGKHYAKYVDTLNQLIVGSPFDDAPLEQIVRDADGEIFNNAAQAWNHAFYWQCLAPADKRDTPRGDFKAALDASFGSVDAFKEQFTEAATKNFGSGWTWLIKHKTGDIDILNTTNAETPLRVGNTPLLTCDVWEHAYYIDYRNERAKYLKGFWSIVNWGFVAQNLAQAPAADLTV